MYIYIYIYIYIYRPCDDCLGVSTFKISLHQLQDAFIIARL